MKTNFRVNLDTAFWRGKRVLLTGHTGFKGGWLTLWLARMGAEVIGVALPPNTAPNLFDIAAVQKSLASSHFVNICDQNGLSDVIKRAQPDILIHLAAQPLVRQSYNLPIETIATNIMGTAHVLNSLREIECVKVALMITTDKVYHNQEWDWAYREEDTLGGRDPYSASKAASEILIDSYRQSFLAARGVRVASARAGNVIGGGDWSMDRLFPDAVRAWQAGQTLDIRRPNAVRPWQHVLEPLHAYMVLVQAMWNGNAPSVAYNFGPTNHETASVQRVVELAQEAWCELQPKVSSQLGAVFSNAKVKWSDDNEGPHEACLLSLDSSRARNILGWVPKWRLEESVTRTVQWYRDLISGCDARTLCYSDIDAFEAAL